MGAGKVAGYRGLLEGRYHKPVIALALLIEPLSEAQACGSYRWEGYGTRVSYEFPVFRIYEGNEEALKASDNPFDWAHLAGLRAWKSRGSEARKLDYLKEMLSLLDDNYYKFQRIDSFFHFHLWFRF